MFLKMEVWTLTVYLKSSVIFTIDLPQIILWASTKLKKYLKQPINTIIIKFNLHMQN